MSVFYSYSVLYVFKRLYLWTLQTGLSYGIQCLSYVLELLFLVFCLLWLGLVLYFFFARWGNPYFRGISRGLSRLDPQMEPIFGPFFSNRFLWLLVWCVFGLFIVVFLLVEGTIIIQLSPEASPYLTPKWNPFFDMSLLHISGPTCLRRTSHAFLCWQNKSTLTPTR